MADWLVVLLCITVPVLIYGMGYLIGKAHRAAINHRMDSIFMQGDRGFKYDAERHADYHAGAGW